MPLDWCEPATQPPTLIWEVNMGGRPGSLWRVGNLGLLWACRGKEPPEGPLYCLKDTRKLADMTPADLLGQRFNVRW